MNEEDLDLIFEWLLQGEECEIFRKIHENTSYDKCVYPALGRFAVVLGLSTVKLTINVAVTLKGELRESCSLNDGTLQKFVLELTEHVEICKACRYISSTHTHWMAVDNLFKPDGW